MEELSNVTTRVTTQCCNNVLHLQCLRNCKYKCPLCRSEALVIDIETTPLVPPPIIMVSADPCRRTYDTIFRSGVILCLGLGCLYYGMEVFTIIPPPPPPPF